MARIDSFLRLVSEQGASDLHLDAGVSPRIRHDGEFIPMPFRALSGPDTERLLTEILNEDQQKAIEELYEVDFVYECPGTGRFRANVFMHSRGMGGVFRVVKNEAPTLDDLRLPRALRGLTKHQNGLVLVCGPTGSGKTSTLAAMIEEINRSNKARHIITIEDPIEFVFEPKHCVITQRQVGMHCESFASALRSALRESPDVIVIGEMRDLETINLALSAAETGVLVFGTLHTNSAAKAIDRIIDALPEDARDHQRGVLSVLLRGIISQHLIKKANGEGRVAAVEVLMNNLAVANMIRENKIQMIEASLAQTESGADGSQGLDRTLLTFIRQGMILAEDGLHLAFDPDWLRRAVMSIPEEN